MAKMRVHELAKELDIKSQTIIEMLSTTEYAVKSVQSGLEEAAQELVRKKFASPMEAKPVQEEKKETVEKKDAAEKKETVEKKESAEKKDAVEKADGTKERPKKKSSISAVYNAQYSKQSRKPSNGNGNGNSNGNNANGQQRNANGKNGNGGQRRENAMSANTSKPEPHSIIRPRPVGERAMRPISERTAGNNDDFMENRPTRNNDRN